MVKLLIGGSPCTHWSIAQTKNRETTAEGIGWELFRNYVIARDKYQPDYFLYENNKSMSTAIREQITTELGVEPVLINSALVSAQNRQRLYWVGKRNPDGTYSQVAVEQPVDRGILLRDILETGIAWMEKSYCITATEYKGSTPQQTLSKHRRTMVAEPIIVNGMESGKARTVDAHMGKLENNLVPRINNPNPAKQQYDCIAVPVPEPVNETVDGKAQCLRATYYKDGIRNLVGNTVDRKTCVAVPVRVGAMPNKDGELGTSQSRRIYSTDGKSVSLPARPNGGGADGAATGLYAVPAAVEYNPLHSCDVVVTDQNIHCTYKDGSGTAQGYTVTFDDVKSPSVITGHAHKMKVIERVADGKQMPVYEVRGGRITIKGKTYPIKLADGFYIIRKLTVTECKRLQTVPDTYAFPVSDTQAYKMLGNGWTVDVIAHIMSHFEGLTEEPVEVLSMYDGMSCGHIALDKLGVDVSAYYATEIDKYAVQTTQHNYPETIQLGDAFQVREPGWALPQKGVL